MRKMEAEQISAQFENQLVDGTSLRLEIDQAQDKSRCPILLNRTGSKAESTVLPRGAESIPPVIWSMPERG